MKPSVPLRFCDDLARPLRTHFTSFLQNPSCSIRNRNLGAQNPPSHTTLSYQISLPCFKKAFRWEIMQARRQGCKKSKSLLVGGQRVEVPFNAALLALPMRVHVGGISRKALTRWRSKRPIFRPTGYAISEFARSTGRSCTTPTLSRQITELSKDRNGPSNPSELLGPVRLTCVELLDLTRM